MVRRMRTGGLTRSVFVIAALCAALALSACGRKSGLDLPPSASASVAAEPEPQQEARSITSPLAKPAKPQPRVVPNRSLPIDVLLN
jgi:predicted small lipoprotein YifL